MKKFFLVSLVLAFFGIAANAQPAGLVGTWKSTTIDVLSDGEVIMSMNCEEAGLSMEFKFKYDNTVTGVIISDGEREESPEMVYAVDGTDILVTGEEGETVTFKYAKGKLSLTMQEDGMDVRLNFEK